MANIPFSNEAKPILITGASGTVGLELAKRLAGQGGKVRAMVRSPEAAGKLSGLSGIEVINGDFDDPVSLDAALRGIGRAFLVTNSSERAESQQLAFVAAAKRAGVSHIVKLSQLHADAQSPVRFLRYHAMVEAAIRQSGISYTMLRPNLFMQGLLAFGQTIAQEGKFFAPIGTSRVSLVDVRDLAEMAAIALTGPGHENKTYDLTGPEALTHAEIADRLGKATGRAVSFVDVPPEAMRAAVIGVGFPQWQADGLIEDYAHYSRDEAAGISDAIPVVTGRPARGFDDFARDYRRAFGAA